MGTKSSILKISARRSVLPELFKVTSVEIQDWATMIIPVMFLYPHSIVDQKMFVLLCEISLHDNPHKPGHHPPTQSEINVTLSYGGSDLYNLFP